MSSVPNGERSRAATGERLPAHSADCLGCGPSNAAGLALEVHREGEHVVTETRFDARHVGTPGLAHGGAVATACDDLFAFVLHLVDVPAVTRTLEVGYRAPVALDTTFRISAWLDRREGRRLFMVAEGVDGDGTVRFDARAVFVVVDPGHWERHGGRTPDRFVDWRA